MTWLLIGIIWLLFDLLLFAVLLTRRPTPRHELPDYLRRAL